MFCHPCVRRVYAPRLLTRHNKDLKWRTLKSLQRVTALGSWTDHVTALRSWMDHVIALRQISVTALLYLEDSRKIHLRGMRARGSKDAKRRAPQHTLGWEGWGEGEREPFGSCFYVFLSPRGLPYVNWVSPECCSTWGPHSGPRTFLCSISMGFSLLYLLATTILDSFSLF